jgi:hypothetical protein
MALQGRDGSVIRATVTPAGAVVPARDAQNNIVTIVSAGTAPAAPMQRMDGGLPGHRYGARLPTEIYPRGCHWFLTPARFKQVCV